MLEGLVHRVIAQLFALSGQLGLGVFMRESVLVRLGVIRRRFVFMRFSGEDDDGIRGDVVWTRSYQRRGHRSDCGLGACAGAWQIWERGWLRLHTWDALYRAGSYLRKSWLGSRLGSSAHVRGFVRCCVGWQLRRRVYGRRRWAYGAVRDRESCWRWCSDLPEAPFVSSAWVIDESVEGTR